MKLLITGANGQLGRCLQDAVMTTNTAAHGGAQLSVSALTRQQLDISDRDAVRQALETHAADIVINAAAYTAVDKAETELDAATQINSNGPKNLAQMCEERGIALIHVSTDYVFDGTATTPYRETDPTSPLGAYGSTKLAGEQAVAQHCTRHIIVRTAWVFSEYGNNFLKTMLRLGAQRSELGIVGDQHGSPTDASNLAEALITIALAIAKPNNAPQAPWGVYHFDGGQATTWHGFATAIFAAAAQRGIIKAAPILNAITTEMFPTPAKRPAYSVLDGHKLQKQFGIASGDWQQGVERVLGKLKTD